MRVLCLLVIFSATAQSQLAARDDTSRFGVTTDKREYVTEPFHYARPWHTYRYRTNIITTFRNTSSKTVFLQRCFPNDTKPMFELIPIFAEESWNMYGPAWACVGHDRQIEVYPGEVRVDTLSIEGPNGHDSKGRVFGRLVGTFRIGLRALDCKDERCALVDSLRFSNAFEVRPAVGKPSSNASMAGCYMLGYMDWEEPLPFAAPPVRFRLDAKSSSRTAGSNAMTVRPLIPLGDGSTAAWAQFSSDSVVVTWRNGPSGYRLQLQPDGPLLYGILEIFSPDNIMVRDGRFTDAVARRVDCDRTFDSLIPR